MVEGVRGELGQGFEDLDETFVGFYRGIVFIVKY